MIEFGYARTPYGQIHYAECGQGDPILLLHQTPRSWDEYREVLPLLGRSHRAVAMDTLGFGASAQPATHTVEAYALGVLALMDALGLESAAVAGHHTGGVIAIETAARAPERVARLVLSSTPLVDAEARERRRRGRRPVDNATERQDGSHLTELWAGRAAFYPPDRPDLLARYVRDALAVWPGVGLGHQAVAAYRMEERLGLICCPVLCVGASADPFGFPELDRLAARLPGATTAVIGDGMVPLEFRAAEFAGVVEDFLG
ncbi:alpha/beta fold hydrolase [Nonomuraea sp. LPB2021202275-12-8]|uniref:alpha/beta fold hydrolase n=1 Tax=Nonomuraea sp. LPB2021202275-12-8 TaxID=3120159 RepID=UPI00300DA7DD